MGTASEVLGTASKVHHELWNGSYPLKLLSRKYLMHNHVQAIFNYNSIYYSLFRKTLGELKTAIEANWATYDLATHGLGPQVLTGTFDLLDACLASTVESLESETSESRQHILRPRLSVSRPDQTETEAGQDRDPRLKTVKTRTSCSIQNYARLLVATTTHP